MHIDLINLQRKGDERGGLIVLENSKEIPFEIKRVYYIFETLPGIRRGFHAHINLKQLLICVSGSCKILLDDGSEKRTIKLDNNHTGLIVHQYIWHEMFDFSQDCVLLALANDFYNENDYIRNYNEFIKIVSQINIL